MKQRKFFLKTVFPAFCMAVCAASLGAEELSLSSQLLYEGERFDSVTVFRAKHGFFDVFAGAEAKVPASGLAAFEDLFSHATARAEAAGAAHVPLSGAGGGKPAGALAGPELSAAAGSITRPSALTRLENPVPLAYTSAAGGMSVPAVGVRSGTPSSLGSHPLGAALAAKLPVSKNAALTADAYVNNESVYAGRLTAALNQYALFPALPSGGKAALQVSAGVFSYRLSPKEDAAWFPAAPYFQPGAFLSYLVEASGRLNLFRKTPPALFYAACGVAESPFGGFAPWTRAEFAVPVPLGNARLTLKGKAFVAGQDYYTPKNTRSPGRTKLSANAMASFPAGAGFTVTGGAAFSYDAYTRLCQTRAAFTFAASGFSALRAGFSASVNGFFNDWNAAPGAAPLTSDSVAGGGLSFSAAFPFAKFTLAGSYRLYPAKLPETLKEEYSVSLAAFPRAASKGADNGKAPGFRGAPDCRLRFDAARNSASFSAELTASASWRVSLRGLSVSAKLAAAIPLPQ